MLGIGWLKGGILRSGESRDMREFRKPLEPGLRNARGAFSLMELVAASAILAVLVGLGSMAYLNGMVAANRVKCLGNQRQIGLALLNYANENDGIFPPTTHSTGSWRKERSWIFQLDPYLENVDEVRICPADPPARRKRIRDMDATSYVLNDLVFDDARYHRPLLIPRRSETLLLTVLNEDRAPSATRDHIHGGEWTSWLAALNDIEPDRHRSGSRTPDRLGGSSNYLYADGSARTLSASDFKAQFDQGINPAEVPLH